jgi:hypothetical protein
MREVMGKDPWAKQEAIARALVSDRRVTVVSCNGAGKSVLAAWLIVWFLNTRQPAIAFSTAPTFPQVEQYLWRHVREAVRSSKKKLAGKIFSTEYRISDLTYGEGRATDTEQQYQGLHAPEGGDLLVVVDEASGVKQFVFDAIRGYLTSPNCYVLYIGNGNIARGPFFESHQRGGFTKFEISAFEVPEHILSRAWIEEMREQCGMDSPQWQVRVMGKFPDVGSDFQLIPRWLLEQAETCTPTDTSGRHMGGDCARGSLDNNVAVLTENGVVREIDFWQSQDLMFTAAKFAGLADKWDVESGKIHIDSIGIGAGVCDRLRQLGRTVDEVRFGDEPQGDYNDLVATQKFSNRRSELHWVARQLLMVGRASIPRKFSQIWENLKAVQYEHNDKGQTVIEAKKKLRARLGSSPDFGDAWVLSLSRMGGRPHIYFF